MRTGMALSSAMLVVVTSVGRPSLASAAQREPTPGAATHQPSGQCVVSDDQQYAFTKEKPVQVGGGKMDGAVRQRRYLESLRGPGGQPVHFKRAGTIFGPDRDETVLDRYVLAYDGLEEPLELYLDWYHFVEPKAPRGFVCGQPMNLGLPPPDPWTATQELMALAIEQGPEHDFEPAPVDSSAVIPGVFYDHFRLVARAVRAGAARGAAIQVTAIPHNVSTPRTIVLAHPRSCEGATVEPTDVSLVDPRGQPVQRESVETQKEAIAALLPGVAVPTSSMAAVYGLVGLGPGLTVKITYREAVCPGGSLEASLPVTYTAARLIESPSPTVPAGVTGSSAIVTLQTVIDHMGHFRRPVVVGGPEELTQAAMSDIYGWRAEPARVNGAPVAAPVVVSVAFKPATPR
jgi:hypothetical protein